MSNQAHYQPLDAMMYPRYPSIRVFMRLSSCDEFISLIALQKRMKSEG